MSGGHRLIQSGVLLFLLGLLTGLAPAALALPRLGVSAHILATAGGTFLIALGLVWPRLTLRPGASMAAARLAIYANYAGWLAPLLGGSWGAGGSMLPIAAGDVRGSAFEEAIIATLLMTAALALIAVCVLVLWGLRAGPPREGA